MINLMRTDRKIREFSKCVVSAMVLLWFVGALYGGIIVWRSGYGLESLLQYISAPVVGGILGYMVKAAFENREKLKRAADQEPALKGEDHP